MLEPNPNIENFILKFPAGERWRLFIDGWRQFEGPLAFDRHSPHSNNPEPGFLKGGLDAFNYALGHATEKFTPTLIEEIHKQAFITVRRYPPDLPMQAGGHFGVILNPEGVYGLKDDNPELHPSPTMRLRYTPLRAYLV